MIIIYIINKDVGYALANLLTLKYRENRCRLFISQ